MLKNIAQTFQNSNQIVLNLAQLCKQALEVFLTIAENGSPMYAITLHQPWASLIALGIKTVETRTWPAPVRLIGQNIAVHAARQVAGAPGPAIDAAMVRSMGEDWRSLIPAGMVVATATLAGMARVERVNLVPNYATHEPGTEAGSAVGRGESRIDPWGDFGPGRWLWFLTEVRPLPEPVPAIGRQTFWRWDGGMMDTVGPISRPPAQHPTASKRADLEF